MYNIRLKNSTIYNLRFKRRRLPAPRAAKALKNKGLARSIIKIKAEAVWRQPLQY